MFYCRTIDWLLATSYIRTLEHCFSYIWHWLDNHCQDENIFCAKWNWIGERKNNNKCLRGWFFFSILNLHWPALRVWLNMKLASPPAITIISECRLLQRLALYFEALSTEYGWFRKNVCNTTQKTSARQAQFETNELQVNKYMSLTHYNRRIQQINREQQSKKKNGECDPRS